MQPAAAARRHPLAEADRRTVIAQALAELDVFHERLLRYAADPLEDLPTHEETLVTCRYASQARAQIHHARDEVEHRMPAL